MEIQTNKCFLLVCILIIQLNKSYCKNNNSNNAFLSKLRPKRDSTIRHYDIWHLLPLLPNMSYHKNLHNLPEKSIYCTRYINSDTGRYWFLRKYYSALQGEPDYYTSDLECIYPRSIEFPELEDEKPLTAVDKVAEAIMMETQNFKEFLDKVNRGEQPEPYKSMDVEALTDELLSEIFHHNPDHLDTLERSAPNGVLCEHIKFNETNRENVVVEIERPVCYPAQRPPQSTIINEYPKTTTLVKKNNDATFLSQACHVLCYTGLIYQLLPCCRQ